MRSAVFTLIRPASPVVCVPPVDVKAPVIGWVPSTNNCTDGLPLVSDVTVDVADIELTTLPLPLALTTCNNVPDGLENCRFEPNARLSCETTELMPAEKSIPIVVLLGFDADAWCPECQYYKLRRAPKKRNPSDDYTY